MTKLNLALGVNAIGTIAGLILFSTLLVLFPLMAAATVYTYYACVELYQGDVVLASDCENFSVTIGSIQADTTVMGVAKEDIAALSRGRVVRAGLVAVKVTGSVSNNDPLRHSSTARTAETAPGMGAGVFARAESDKGIYLPDGTYKANQVWATLGPFTIASAGVGAAPNDAEYWTGGPHGTLTIEHDISALDNGIIRHEGGTPYRATPGLHYAAATVYKIGDWGCECDGVTDDLTDFQYVINTVETLGGGVVEIPRGTCLVSGALSLPSRVTIRGQGPHASIIKLADNSDSRVIESYDFDNMTGSDTWLTSGGVCYALGLEDLSIDGNGGNQSGGDYAVALYAKGYKIKNVQIVDAYGVGLYSEAGDATGQSDETDMPSTDIGWVQIKDPGSHGLQYRGPHDGYIQHVEIGNSIGGDGARFETDGSTYDGTCDINYIHVYGAAGYGIYVDTDIRAQHLNAGDCAKECLYLTSDAIGAQLGKLYLARADTGDSGTYWNLYSEGTYLQIAELRISDTHTSAGGANIAGIHTNIGSLNIYSDGGAGTGLRVGANALSAFGRIVGYSDSGGKGVETGAGAARNGCLLELHVNNCATAWTNSNVGKRNIYIGSIWATAAQEIIAGSGPDSSNGDELWIVNSESIDDSSEGRWLDNVMTLNVLQAWLDIYCGRLLIGEEITPPGNNPDANTLWQYAKDLSGVSRWYSKDSAGTERRFAYPGELLSGTDPDVSQKGDIAQDTDDAVIRVYDDGKQKGVLLDPNIGFAIADPENLPTHGTRSTISKTICKNTSSLTYVITSIYAISDEDDYTFLLFESGGETDIGTANDSQIDSVVCEDNGTACYYKHIMSGFDDSTIAPGRWLIFEHSSGTAEDLAIAIKGYYDANID